MNVIYKEHLESLLKTQIPEYRESSAQSRVARRHRHCKHPGVSEAGRLQICALLSPQEPLVLILPVLGILAYTGLSHLSDKAHSPILAQWSCRQPLEAFPAILKLVPPSPPFPPRV